MKYRWNLLDSSPQKAQALVQELGISDFVAHLLVLRGLEEPGEALNFLRPTLSQLNDPYLMKEMNRVVKRIFEALENHEKIFVYGDYDVDGITSTVVLKRALEMLGGEVEYHIPERLEEGYGLQVEVLKAARDRGCRLVISVDTGIRAFEPCLAAREIGLDLIVTDHHLPDLRLPAAYAILNPKRPDCPYPDKNLAAVGVVFKLVQALFEETGRTRLIPHFLKIVSLGTIADMVPLTGENRVLTKFGLEGLSEPRNLGLQALLEGVGLSGEVTFLDVGFKLAPRINAVTRMGGGREVVDLFSISDPLLAQAIVQEMNLKNSRRQQEERKILGEIEARMESNPGLLESRFLVVEGEGWHRGVIGVVASRLLERFHRPVLVLSRQGDSWQGSGRSIAGYNMLEALDSCREFFERYGGHAQAVGVTIRGGDEEIQELRRGLSVHAENELAGELLIASLGLDLILPLHDLSLDLYQQMQLLAPFGAGNPLPIFASKNLRVVGPPRVLKNHHLKLELQQNGTRLPAIWWKNGDAADSIGSGSTVDVAYALTRDSYRGLDRLSLTIRDLHCDASACRV